MKPFLAELRPQRDTVTTVLLGAWFITLGVLKILLMKFSENDHGGYDYLPVTVNVCAELLKLFVCGTIAIWVKYTEEGSFKDKFTITRHEVLSLLRWSVPGLLYFLDNLMQFYVITYFHPAMAVLLSNFVIITTSLLFRLILKRVLTSIQWASLAVLFLAIVSLSSQSHHVGPESSTVQKPQAIDHVIVSSLNHHDQICMVGQNLINNETTQADQTPTTDLPFSLNMGHLLVILQCFIASSANIYNEKIFKEGNGLQESIFIQNSKLYMFGVLFNAITPLIIPSYRRRLFECGFFYGHNSYSVALLFDVTLFGLTVSIILKFRDNMFHVLGAQITTVIVITSSIYLFHFVPTLQFFLTAPIVLLAVFIYNAARVKTNNKTKHSASLVRTQEERNRPEGIELLPRQRHNSASKTSDEETEDEI